MKKEKLKLIVQADIERLKIKICCTTAELNLSLDTWKTIDYHLACIYNLIHK